MIDVSAKRTTKRKAIAFAKIILGKRAFEALKNDQSPKGNVLEVAKTAGIMAAKLTPSLIPLCHPLEISKARVECKFNEKEYSVDITSEVAYKGRTGVEMEALTAVSVAALTIYDMMKWKDKGMVISEIKLLHKSGGKSGNFDI